MRFLFIGAHPDDCDEFAGGTLIALARTGHTVKCVSVTDGSAGHQTMSRREAARVRLLEAKRAGEVAGAGYEVMDIADGMLEANLVSRHRLMAVIRLFAPDVIVTHRPNDYHPDHRATGLLVQDCSYLMMVPNVCPEVPPLRKQPVILLACDGFQKPCPFQADIAVSIDETIDAKTDMLCCHRSQVFDWLLWIEGRSDLLSAGEDEKYAFVSQSVRERAKAQADKYGEALVKTYGENGKRVKYAEAFEISEYGAAAGEDVVGVMAGKKGLLR